MDGKIFRVEWVNKIRLEIRERSCTGSTHKGGVKKRAALPRSITIRFLSHDDGLIHHHTPASLAKSCETSLSIDKGVGFFSLLSSSNFLAQNASTLDPRRDCTISKFFLKHKCKCLCKRSGIYLCSVSNYVLISTPCRDSRISKG